MLLTSYSTTFNANQHHHLAVHEQQTMMTLSNDVLHTLTFSNYGSKIIFCRPAEKYLYGFKQEKKHYSILQNKWNTIKILLKYTIQRPAHI